MNKRPSRDQAVRAMLEHLPLPLAQPLPPASALGMACAETVLAPGDIPAEPRSAMDGFALAARDTLNASPQAPVFLDLRGQSRPSAPLSQALGPGEAAEVLTGAALPPGADSVVPQEQAEVSDGRLRLVAPAEPGRHLRRPGSDMAAGAVLAAPGQMLGPALAASLVLAGYAEVSVFQPGAAAVLAVGNELLAPGEEPAGPHDPRFPADNIVLLDGLLRGAGLLPAATGVCRNETADIAEALAQARERLPRPALLLTTGGTGPGRRDFTRRAAMDAGLTPVFHGLAMHPAKSAFCLSGDGLLLLGLPGSPPAVFAAFHGLILPLVRRLRGIRPETPPMIRAGLEAPSPAPAEAERLVLCGLRFDGARALARPLTEGGGFFGANSRLPLIKAQALAFVPPGMGNETGETVDVLLL